MPDYTDNSLRAAIKALADVVAPAVDPANPLAVEQLRLTVQYLEFYATRRSQLAAYGRAGFQLHVDLAESLAEILRGRDDGLRAELLSLSADARDLAGEWTDAAVGRATSGLASLVSTVVREAQADDDAARRRVERIVVERSGALLDLKRAWFLPFGFESAPDRVPALADLLAPPAPA